MWDTTIITWVKEVGKLLPNADDPETIPEVGELDELENSRKSFWLLVSSLFFYVELRFLRFILEVTSSLRYLRFYLFASPLLLDKNYFWFNF